LTLLEIHPLAEIFPPMSDEGFAALVSDIRENGLREAIILHEGKVLDGRNRYRACTELGIEPITKPWDQRGDALDYVVSKNLHRRHLDDRQRAGVAAKIESFRHGGSRKPGDQEANWPLDPPQPLWTIASARLAPAMAAVAGDNQRVKMVMRCAIAHLHRSPTLRRLAVRKCDTPFRQIRARKARSSSAAQL
jgi:hypothetical protein